MLAITGHKLKRTMLQKQAKKLTIGMISEMIEVFESYGIKILPYCGKLDYYKFTSRSLSGWIYRKIMFGRFVNQNGDMSSSILRSLENKKKTELDNMSFKVVKMAYEKNIYVPFNETISNFLRDVENGKESIFMENLNNPCFVDLKIKWR